MKKTRHRPYTCVHTHTGCVCPHTRNFCRGSSPPTSLQSVFLQRNSAESYSQFYQLSSNCGNMVLSKPHPLKSLCTCAFHAQTRNLTFNFSSAAPCQMIYCLPAIMALNLSLKIFFFIPSLPAQTRGLEKNSRSSKSNPLLCYLDE